MKHCRNGWKEKCLKIYTDCNDFEHCPYCGVMMVWTMPWKQFFQENENVEFASNYFGETTEDILKLINELEKNHHVINIKITEIIDWDDKPELYSATVTFEVTEETNIDKLFLAMHKYKPDEFDKVSNWISYSRRPGIYRMWWD